MTSRFPRRYGRSRGCSLVPEQCFREPPVRGQPAAVMRVSPRAGAPMVSVGGHRAMLVATKALHPAPTLRVHPGAYESYPV